MLSSFAFQLSGSFRSPLLEYFRKSNCPRASLVAIFRKSGHVSLENLRGNNGEICIRCNCTYEYEHDECIISTLLHKIYEL